MSAPVGTVDGLPIEIPFVGDHFEDSMVLAAVRE